MTPLERLLSPEQPYVIRFAAAATRGLPVPEFRMSMGRTFTRWTPDLDDWLRREYAASRDVGDLAGLAKRMGLTVTSIQSRAPKLGLTRKRRPR